MTPHPIDTEALRRLADAATPGPWIAHVNMYGSEFGDYHGAHIPGVAEPVETEWNGAVPPLSPADADLIEAYHRAVPALLDLLAAAEHRATRAEAQAAIRGRAVAIYRERARDAEAERGRAQGQADRSLDRALQLGDDLVDANVARHQAEARIKAVEDVLYASDDGTEHEHNHGTLDDCGDDCPACWALTIRRALDGSVTPPTE